MSSKDNKLDSDSLIDDVSDIDDGEDITKVDDSDDDIVDIEDEEIDGDDGDDDEEDDGDDDEVDEEDDGDDEEVEAKEDIQMKKKMKNANIKTTSLEVLDIDETYGKVYEDSDEEDDYETFEKFDEDIKRDYILEHHNEIIQQSYEEINALTTIIRDDDGIIIDPLHTTVPFVTRYERAKIIGVRAKQIHNGAEPFIDVADNVIDGHIIAEMEYKAKKLPFIIMRPFPDGRREYWKLKDLQIIDM